MPLEKKSPPNSASIVDGGAGFLRDGKGKLECGKAKGAVSFDQVELLNQKKRMVEETYET